MIYDGMFGPCVPEEATLIGFVAVDVVTKHLGHVEHGSENIHDIKEWLGMLNGEGSQYHSQERQLDIGQHGGLDKEEFSISANRAGGVHRI